MYLASSIEPELTDFAARLAGHPIDSIALSTKGGNSSIYRVEGNGVVYALKAYARSKNDTRDRLGVEAQSLTFMHANGIADVPRLHAVDKEIGGVLLGWVEGDLVGNDVEGKDIDQALNFLSRIARSSLVPGAEELPMASESCLCGAEVLRQIEKRLRALDASRTDHPELAFFLDEHVLPALEDAGTACRQGYGDAGLDFDVSIERSKQSLIPADFGFHNVMRRPDGSLVFLDFEYFGWDDPVKLAADFLLHPGMALEVALRRHFADGIRKIFAKDEDFSVRLTLLFPLFALRWSLILLNEFLPGHERGKRALADGSRNGTLIKRDQLEKAALMLGNVAALETGELA